MTINANFQLLANFNTWANTKIFFANDQPEDVRLIQQMILGATSGRETTALATDIRGFQPFQCIATNDQYRPYSRIRFLPYFERDEARHVALGTHYLPAMIDAMSAREQLDFFIFQFKLLTLEIWTSYGISRDLKSLGVDPEELLEVGRAKQFTAVAQLWEHLPVSMSQIPREILNRYGDICGGLVLREEPLKKRIRRAVGIALRGLDFESDMGLDPDVKDEDVPLIRGLGRERDRHPPSHLT